MDETHLTQLGRDVRGFDSPEAAVLERVPNPQSDTLYLARFTVTRKVAPLSLPLVSVAEQWTRVRPTVNQAPDFGRHSGWIAPSTSSRAETA